MGDCTVINSVLSACLLLASLMLAVVSIRGLYVVRERDRLREELGRKSDAQD